MSEAAGSETPALAPSHELEAARPPRPAALGSQRIRGDKPGATASDAPSSRNPKGVKAEPGGASPAASDPGDPLPRPGRKDLFFRGRPATSGALQILTGFLHISCGVILAAAPNLVASPTTYWHLLAGGLVVFITGAATLMATANCTTPRHLDPGHAQAMAIAAPPESPPHQVQEPPAAA